ncbi:MAG: proton-conducting transporter membrane subunit, partial [Aggregatilineales bacterium]
TYPQLIPLVILIPAIGAVINFFLGHKLTERMSGLIGIGASVLSFFVACLIFSFLNASHGDPNVVNPVAFFDGWLRIESVGLEIPWQFRVDTLTGTMLMVVTGVGSLIHIYSLGYMHGDRKFGLFFGYLNMFMMFMLLLVTANNFLMLFVGWEGVGVCSFLLIGFWWDKKKGGWDNSNAAKKAMLANRVGDFGILMAIFLTFWTFGTLDFYRAGEVTNVPYTLGYNGYADPYGGHGEDSHGEDTTDADHSADADASHEDDAADDDHSEETSEDDHSEAAEDSHGEDAADDDHSEDADDHSEVADDGHGAAVADSHGADDGGHGEDDGHGDGHAAPPKEELDNSLFAPDELGIFGQIEYRMSLPEDHPLRTVSIGGGNTVSLDAALFLIIVFMMLGVSGKSAQFPLLVWLPDAMAGPTPVSALMHAATMVTAGVFLLARSNILLDASDEGRFLIAIIGVITALFGGVAALGQWDIKRVLAFSTISQLGFMVAAIGLGAYVAAMFHLVTHAVFKALLFLGSGSVIHGVEHGEHHVHEHGDHHDDEHAEDFDPQDMRNMGGLRKRMPITFWTYMIGTLALAGIFPFAGFWSKDEILADAWEVGFNEGLLEGYIVLGGLLIAAGFTAFYMWRQIQMVFYGDPRSEAAEHAPENSPWMTIPLIVLAFFSVIIGFINIPGGSPVFWSYKEHEFSHFLESVIPSVTGHSLSFNWLVALIATGAALGAMFLAHTIYAGNKAVIEEENGIGKDPLEVRVETRPLFEAANRRLYLDDIYEMLVLRPYRALAHFFANVIDWALLHDYFHNNVLKAGYDGVAKLLSQPFDQGIIDATVNGVGWLVQRISRLIQPVQTGYVRTYAVAVLLGVVVVLVLMLLPLLQNAS